MNLMEDLQRVEEHTYRSVFDDGLVDLFAVVVLLGFGIAMVTGSFVPMIPIYALPFLWPLIRKRWITPRMGYVRFSAGRRQKERRAMHKAVVAGLLVFLAGAALAITIGVQLIPIRRQAVVHSIGLMFTLAMLTIMVTMRIRRFAVYATAMLLAAVAGVALGLSAEVYVNGIGAAVTVAGVAMLWRFARKHPAIPPEEHHATG